jgi:SHAQKYF class myb-like DNA-binding protein
MVESYSPFVIFEEKNPRKFSIEIEHPNYIGLTHPKFEVDKGINFSEEEKPSNIFMPNKTSTFNSTNIFLISNIKENNKNETKFSQFSQNVSENNNNYQNIFEEKQKINTSKENENSDSNNNEYHSGRWTNEEHDKFIEGILKYGNEWKRVQSIIKTRSSTQARSHAQKFFLRMKKEINPKNFSNLETLLQYIINSTTNKTKSYTPLTNEQKDRLFSVIRSNLKPEENQNKNNDSQYANKKDSELGLDYINEEEDDNLAYNKANNVLNKKMSISDIGEKRKVTFCSKKRKNNSDYILSVNDNKIFSIKKDMNHKRSMDITKSSDNFINNLGKKTQDIKKTLNELNNNNSINNINNINNNNIYINNNNNYYYLNNNNHMNINNNNNKIRKYEIKNHLYNYEGQKFDMKPYKMRANYNKMDIYKYKEENKNKFNPYLYKGKQNIYNYNYNMKYNDYYKHMNAKRERINPSLKLKDPIFQRDGKYRKY